MRSMISGRGCGGSRTVLGVSLRWWVSLDGCRSRGFVAMITVRLMVVVGSRFGQRVADVIGNRLAGTVIPTVPHPTGKLRHRGPRRVIADRGRLCHRVRLNLEHSGPARQHRLGDIL